jgi:hypothetical protein
MPVKRRRVFSKVSLRQLVVWPQKRSVCQPVPRCSSSLALIRSSGDLNEAI